VLGLYRDRVATAMLRAPFNTPRTPNTKNLGPIDSIVEEKLASLGANSVGSTAEEFEKFWRAESDRWGKMIRAVGIRLD